MSDTHEYRVFVLVLSANTREYRIFTSINIRDIHEYSPENASASIDLAALANIRIRECIVVTLLAEGQRSEALLS